MKYIIMQLATFIFIASLFSACMDTGYRTLVLPEVQEDTTSVPNPPINPPDPPDPIEPPEPSEPESVIPADAWAKIKDYMPDHKGNTPPAIDGVYLINPMKAKYASDNKPDETFMDLYIHFYNQEATSISYKETDVNRNDTTRCLEAQISGEGDYFTIYIPQAMGLAKGIHVETRLIISGKKTSQGISNLTYALFLIDKDSNADPDNQLMEIGNYRVYYDGNSLAETSSWPPFPGHVTKSNSQTVLIGHTERRNNHE